MISMTTKKLRDGMVTAQSIYNTGGANYLTKGTRLTPKYIERLKQLGVSRVNVTSLNPDLNVLPPEDIVQEETRTTAIHRVFSVFQNLEFLDKGIDALNSSSETIVLDLLERHENLVQMTDLRLHDDYTFSHSVNVSILATMIGCLCGLPKSDLCMIALGGMLHDIGKINIASEILNKPTKLTDEEFSIMKSHPEKGRERLSKLKSPLAPILADIAGQHHEHLDGRGYPRHLKGKQIHLFSRIMAIADVYDALTSERSYKRAYKPHTAYGIMGKCSSGQFDEDLLKLFFDNVALYPVGTVVKINGGYAIVTKVKSGMTRTPTVCLFADANQRMLESPRAIDLSACPPSTLERPLEDREVYDLVARTKCDPAIYLTKNG